MESHQQRYTNCQYLLGCHQSDRNRIGWSPDNQRDHLYRVLGKCDSLKAIPGTRLENAIVIGWLLRCMCAVGLITVFVDKHTGHLLAEEEFVIRRQHINQYNTSFFSQCSSVVA
jgi:hypothetical protein